MAELVPVADPAAPFPFPTTEDIERVQSFTREPFVLDGEEVADALAPGSARRRAFDAALTEVAGGAERPSIAWRRDFSLMLGLERLLGQEEPALVDGTVLSAHQVDALSGTLTALLAEAQNGVAGAKGNGNGNGAASVEDAPLASSGIPGAAELPEDLVEDEPEEEPQDWADEVPEAGEEGEEAVAEAPDDPNADRRFWFEHATGAGKTVAALGFVEASRTGGVLILTHRRNLVDQFHGELRDRGYRDRISPALLGDRHDPANGPVTVETYQWFVRNAGKVSDAYTIVICDEAHTALGEKTSASIREWAGPVFIGMTATGALIARHVTDLFPTQTSRFDLAQAARRGVIAPLRCVRIPPGPGVRTIAKVPLRRGEVDVEFDQEMLAELLDQQPFNMAVADLYKTRFDGVPGVIYAAGVRHAYNVAEAFREVGLKARGVSGETPKRELAETLAAYERGDVDVLVNAQLLAEGWNSPRATVCMHLAPTASKRIYQQRVGRVTRRHPGKESGIVGDFAHPATKHDDAVVTLQSLLNRDVYRGGAIVVGPVRRGRGRRLRVERRVVPVASDENRRIEVFERELWRIAVEYLDYGEQIQWAALAGARVVPNGWRRARAMLQFDANGELKRAFLLTALQRNKNPQLRLRALQEIALSKDAEAFDDAVEVIGGWSRDERREGVKVVLQALAEKKIGRRDQANNWIWRCAEYTREVHEEYAVQRWPETKRLLGLLVNSSGGAHARNARRLVQASRQQDRRLSAALLAAAIPHTAEAGGVINGARTRMSRKPAALARELLRNFPKAGGRRGASRRRKKGGKVREEAAVPVEELAAVAVGEDGAEVGDVPVETDDIEAYSPEVTASDVDPPARKRRSRRRKSAAGPAAAGELAGAEPAGAEPAKPEVDVAAEIAAVAAALPKRSRSRGRRKKVEAVEVAEPEVVVVEAVAEEAPAKPKRASRAKAATAGSEEEAAPAKPKRASRARAATAGSEEEAAPAKPKRASRAKAATAGSEEEAAPAKPKRASRAKAATAGSEEEAAPAKPKRASRAKAATAGSEEEAAPAKPKRASRAKAATAASGDEAPAEPKRASRAKAATASDDDTPPKPKRASRAKAATAASEEEAAPKPKRTTRRRTSDEPAGSAAEPPKRPRRRATATATETDG